MVSRYYDRYYDSFSGWETDPSQWLHIWQVKLSATISLSENREAFGHLNRKFGFKMTHTEQILLL